MLRSNDHDLASVESLEDVNSVSPLGPDDLAHADTLPEAQYVLGDLELANTVHDRLSGESKILGEPSPANLEYKLADFLEAYGQAIEDEAARRETLAKASTPEARQILLDTLRYFENRSGNIRLWPQKGLYLFAMLTDIDVASSALGVTEDDLRRALTQRAPNFTWEKWHAFGAAILADTPNGIVQEQFKVASRTTIVKWRKILTGTTSPGRKVA